MGHVKTKLYTILVLSFILRIIPVIVLSYFEHIQKGELLLTDIDYKVYSDSTTYPTPYERHTYRYTPLLSYMMTWNYTVAEWIGKAIFAVFDVVAIFILWHIIAKSGD
jgi:phosphatidylinositol glycan class M